MSTTFRFGIKEMFEKLKEVRGLNRAKTDVMYVEMHNDAYNDLLADPDLDSYLGYSRNSKTSIEQLLDAKIFLHDDSSKRYVLTITYRTDFLVGGKSG